MKLRGAPALLLAVALLHAASDATDAALWRAADAWDRGDYIAALETYQQILASPAPDRAIETIALQTGELFRTIELTTNGGAPKFSPDGRLVAHEEGTGTVRVTRLLTRQTGATFTTVATLPGFGASFSPDGARLAYLRVIQSKEMDDLQAAVDGSTGTTRAIRANQLAELVARTATIVVRDLASGRETEVDTGAVRKSSIVAGAGGSIAFVGWAAEGDPDEIYLVSPGVQPRSLTGDKDDKAIVDVNSTGTALLFRPRRPASVEEAGTFGVVALPGGRVTTIAGSAPSFSADGRMLTYVIRDATGSQLMIAPVQAPAAATVVRRGGDRLDAPALAPDGSAALFQMMTRDDWEIFHTTTQPPVETRVTREIQHDILPRFLTSSRLLAMIGEPRHRRSYLYEWPSLKRTRLFHNNTVRTIAPEYAWVPDRSGTKLLVVADRDGDTVSAARGVYLVDLAARVTRDDLRTRVAASLAEEQALRSRAARLFAPIAEAVRRVVEAASTGRIFDYQKALFDFDSKHVTKPGNARASKYLFDTFASFGYTPELQRVPVRNASAIQTFNVLATLRGTTHPEVIYVVSSHYDSVDEGPGADDDSSGTAALLETARILENHPQPATIVFASFTGEESGLLGSREYVRQAQAAALQIAAVVNNDMIGWANDHRLDATVRYSNPGLREVQHAAAMQFSKLITYDALYYKNTDAAAFSEPYGDIVTGLGGYPILGNPHYHEPSDVLDTINHQLVTEVAKTTAATVMLLASSPSRVKGLTIPDVRDGKATVTWAASPEKDVTGYVVAWGPAGNPEAQVARVAKPEATLTGVQRGMVVSVKAVNAKGLDGWAWARAEVE